MLGHPLELAIVFIIGLLVFGPKKLPEITRNVGRGINAFRKGIDGFTLQGESVDEAEMIERRRELAALELQILEKKEEMARQEMEQTEHEAPFASYSDDITTETYNAETADISGETLASSEPVAYEMNTPATEQHTTETAYDDAESATVRVKREDIKHVLESAQAEQNLTQNA